MREYLEIEFSDLKEALKDSDKIKFDIEKIIDDWVYFYIIFVLYLNNNIVLDLNGFSCWE